MNLTVKNEDVQEEMNEEETTKRVQSHIKGIHRYLTTCRIAHLLLLAPLIFLIVDTTLRGLVFTLKPIIYYTFLVVYALLSKFALSTSTDAINHIKKQRFTFLRVYMLRLSSINVLYILFLGGCICYLYLNDISDFDLF